MPGVDNNLVSSYASEVCKHGTAKQAHTRARTLFSISTKLGNGISSSMMPSTALSSCVRPIVHAQFTIRHGE
jgi:hypothetical protein